MMMVYMLVFCLGFIAGVLAALVVFLRDVSKVFKEQNQGTSEAFIKARL